MPKTTDKTSATSKLRDLKLNSLLEVTKAINSNVSTEHLLGIFESILKGQLNIGKAVVFDDNEGWSCLLKFGVGDDFSDIDVNKDLLHIKEIGTVNFPNRALNKDFEIIIPVYHKSKPLAFVLIGDIEDKLEVSPTIKHLPFIQTLANIIVVAIENKRLAKENVRQAAVKKELELASEMQNMLFPSSLPDNNVLQIAAVYQPHQQVGGDYYDYIELNEREMLFCMADVSGKGVAAALLMSNFQANLRVLAKHTHSLTDLVKQLNERVMDSAKGEKFITLFIARYNLATGTLNYINAGHNPPLLMSDGKIHLLNKGCTGLGMFDELHKIKEGLVGIFPKSVIVCYTDGIVELENEQGEDYGVMKLSELLLSNQKLSMKALNELIIKKVKEHKGKRDYIDDITLFSCRIY